MVEINNEGIINGRLYKHYKGGLYSVLGFAIHEKTLKTIVLYRDILTGQTWGRFASEFAGDTEIDGGKTTKRFTLTDTI